MESLASQAAISLENARLYADLQEREIRLRRLFDSNIIGIFTWDLEGRIIDANQAFMEIVGYEGADITSGAMRWQDLMPAEWNAHDDPVMATLLTSSVVAPFEAEYVRKDRCRVPVLIGAALFDGKKTEGVAFVLDLTDRNRAELAARDSERRINDMKLQLADLNRVASIGQLSATIAHEINQPLSGLITNASTGLRMLSADPPDLDGAREAAKRGLRDGGRAADVIAKLRNLFSNRELSLKPLDLNDATREVLEMAIGDMQSNKVIVRSELAESLPLVSGDRIQLQQVVLNLLRNASDAMLGIHDRPRLLVIGTERDGADGVCLSVRDAGVGIGPGDTERLFAPFYSTKNTGMGVGLSLSRSIIERHSGRLWAEPNGDHGTTFKFSIPCCPR